MSGGGRGFARQSVSALVEKDLRVLTPPHFAPITIFTDQNAEPNAGAPVTILAARAEIHHPVAELVADRRDHRHRSAPRPAVIWSDRDPAAAWTPHVAAVLIIIVAARARLSLRGDRCARGGPDYPSGDR